MALTTIVFLIIILTGTVLLVWLSLRQSRHVALHRDAVPADFAQVIDLPTHQHAAAYSNAKSRLERVDLVVGLIVTLGWTLGGGIEALTRS